MEACSRVVLLYRRCRKCHSYRSVLEHSLFEGSGVRLCALKKRNGTCEYWECTVLLDIEFESRLDG